MQVSTATNQTTSGTSAASTASTKNSSTVDYNSFLKLLVQEMKNQDPTTPTDPTQYMSQLASFSQVEQQVNTNTRLDSILTSSSLTQAENMIGRKVTSGDGTQSGQVVSVALSTGGKATATLTDGSTMTLDSTVKVSAS